jgi:hypothetical protein
MSEPIYEYKVSVGIARSIGGNYRIFTVEEDAISYFQSGAAASEGETVTLSRREMAQWEILEEREIRSFPTITRTRVDR